MSNNLLENFSSKYDFVSWPDQDEFLEGPTRDKSYYEYITDVYNSSYTYIQFDNFVYWFTDKDDLTQKNISKRIIYYSIFNKCAPRIRAWKMNVTNIRIFNHNPLDGDKYPINFKLRHYPFRNIDHFYKRLYKDRSGLERNGNNYHYNAMLKNLNSILAINSTMFHIDDGINDLNSIEKFDWDIVYKNSV